MGVAREVVQVTLGVATAALVGTLYVLVHEKRRKMKALRRGEAQGGSSPDGQRNSSVVTKEQLIRILEESSAAAYQLIEQACGTPERRSIPCVPCSKYAATWASRALQVACGADSKDGVHKARTNKNSVRSPALLTFATAHGT